MKKKFSCIFIIFVFLTVTIIFGYRDVIFKPDYSDVELVYENDANNRYYYSKLSDNAKIAYTLILPQLYNHAQRVEIPEINEEEFEDIMYALSYDNPELFCIGLSSKIKSEGNIFYYYPSYTHDINACQSQKTKFDNAVNKAVSGVKPSMSEYEKELYIHDYICKVCKYDSDSDGSKVSSAYDVLVNGEAVCEGYAKAVKLLLDRLSISNYLITGEAKDESGKVIGHMWNVVKIDGGNYHLDATWDDMDSDDTALNHFYFNVSDEMIAKTHFKLSPSENNCGSMKMNYCNVNGMHFAKYDETAKKALSREIYEKYKAKSNVCEFSFADKNEYELALKNMVKGDELSEIIHEIRRVYGKVNYNSVEYITDENMYAFMFVFS